MRSHGPLLCAFCLCFHFKPLDLRLFTLGDTPELRPISPTKWYFNLRRQEVGGHGHADTERRASISIYDAKKSADTNTRTLNDEREASGLRPVTTANTPQR